MKNMQQEAPECTTDADGQQLVHVALANTDQRATMYADDYRRWLTAGFSRHWSFVSTGGRFRYVLASVRSPSNSKRSLTVARWIAGAGKGEQVRHVDGDRLNLRSENLTLVKGAGASKAASHWLRPNDGTPTRRKTKPSEDSQHDVAQITFSSIRPLLIPEVAAKLSPAVCSQLERCGFPTADEAIRVFVAASHEAFMASWDGEPQAVFGVVEWPGDRPKGVPKVGVPWVMSAQPPSGIRMEFMRLAEDIRDRWLQMYPILANDVDAQHVRALHWLSGMGFKPFSTKVRGDYPFIEFGVFPCAQQQ